MTFEEFKKELKYINDVQRKSRLVRDKHDNLENSFDVTTAKMELIRDWRSLRDKEPSNLDIVLFLLDRLSDSNNTADMILFDYLYNGMYEKDIANKYHYTDRTIRRHIESGVKELYRAYNETSGDAYIQRTIESMQVIEEYTQVLLEEALSITEKLNEWRKST